MGKYANVAPENLVDFLNALTDPRIDRTKKHELIDVPVIAVCAPSVGQKVGPTSKTSEMPKQGGSKHF